jgi:flagellar motility protein MotE (MotC chaperone)
MGPLSHDEGEQMKSFWTYFVTGAFVVLLLGVGVRSALGEKSEPAPATLQAAPSAKGGVEDLARSLNEKEKALQDKELRLADWESRLKTQEDRIKSRVEELRILTDMQNKNSQELSVRRQEIEGRMIKTFETMNPKKAAEVLSVMDDALAVEVLMAMKSKKVATIMDKMDSNKAMLLQTKIAERKPASK